MRRTTTLSILAVAVAAIAGGLGWWLVMPAAVTTAPPARGPAVEAIYATGTVEPERWIKIGPTIPGRIDAIHCVEGDQVTRGKLLVKLEDRSARAKLSELEAMVHFQQQEVDRYGKLLERDIASRQAYERAKSALDQGLASVEAARQAVADTAVTAPIDAIVLRKDGEVGEVVKAGDPICWIGREKPLRITAEIDEEDIPRVAVGQRALIRADAFPNTVFEGQVSEITPQGDPVNKSYRTRIALPEDSPLLVGMTTEVNIVVREEPAALLLPVESLRNGTVWLAVDGVARRRPVTTGVFGDGTVEIRAGLAGNESVIVDPPKTLSDGDPVRIRSR